MASPFLGQIQPFCFNFAPRNWALCNGQLLPIQQNTALFSLLGTMYGGNGQTTFALPDLRSRVPMHFGTFAGNTYSQGEMAGEESVALLVNQMPQHTHTFSGTSAVADSKSPTGAYAQSNNAGTSPGDNYYAPGNSPAPLNPATVGATGSNVPHTNLQPYLTVNWCIAQAGIFPARN